MEWKIIIVNFLGAFVFFLIWFLTALLSGWIFDKNGDYNKFVLIVNILIISGLFIGATVRSSIELSQSKEHDAKKLFNQRKEKYLSNLDSLLKDKYSPFDRLMFKEIFIKKWESLEKEVETLNLNKKEKVKLLSALRKGEYENAEKSLISITNKEAFELSRTIFETGNIYFIQHKLNKALECFQKASEFNPAEPAIFYEIGNIYFLLDDLKKAFEFQLRALTIAKRKYGDDHPTIGSILNSIGNICSKKGQHQDAIQYYLESLTMTEKYIKFDHPSIGSIYNNLGIEYEAINEKEKAILYTEKALKTFKNFAGKENDSFVQSLKEKLRKLKNPENVVRP